MLTSCGMQLHALFSSPDPKHSQYLSSICRHPKKVVLVLYFAIAIIDFITGALSVWTILAISLLATCTILILIAESATVESDPINERKESKKPNFIKHCAEWAIHASFLILTVSLSSPTTELIAFNFFISILFWLIFAVLQHHSINYYFSSALFASLAIYFANPSAIQVIPKVLISELMIALILVSLINQCTKEMKLCNSKDKLRNLYCNLLNATNEAIIIVDENKNLLFKNSRAIKDIEINEQNVEAKLKHFTNKYTKMPLFDYIFNSNTVHSHHKSMRYTSSIKKELGKERHHEVKCLQLYYKNSIAIFLKDVTEEVELQSAKSNEYFLQQVMCSISHELLNPVNIIKGTLELFSKEYTGDVDLIDTICNSTQILYHKIRDFIDYGTLCCGTFKQNIHACHVDDLLKLLYKICSNMINGDGIELRFNVHKSIPSEVELDSDRLMQILLKLISNAIKHTILGKVELNVIQISPIKLLFEVTDTGPGIPVEVINYVYTEKRSKIISDDNSSSEKLIPRTANIGLLTIKKILAKLNSQLCINTKEGKGTSISFVLLISNMPKRRRSSKIISVMTKSSISSANREAPSVRVTTKCISNSNYLKGLRTLNMLEASMSISNISFKGKQLLRQASPLHHQETMVTKFRTKLGINPKHMLNAKITLEEIPDEISVKVTLPSDTASICNRKVIGIKSIMALIVDDMKQNRMLLKRFLKDFTAIKVMEFGNGKEVYEYILGLLPIESLYLIILMDIDMPIMNGIESAKAIMSIASIRSKVTIIGVSAFKEQLDVEACLSAGMTAHMAKPVDKVKFIETVGELVERNK